MTNKQELREAAESTIGILGNIAGFEPSDIDGDTVELRFETEDGFDTGCDVSIVDQCQKAADVVRALLDELESKDRRIEEEIGRANREHHRGFMMACGHMNEHANVHYADAAEMEIAALRQRIDELEAVKCKFSDSKLLSLAKDIVENLVDTGGSDPEYTKQYVDWTCKRIRAAGRINGEG